MRILPNYYQNLCVSYDSFQFSRSLLLFSLPAERKRYERNQNNVLFLKKKYVSNIPSGQVPYFLKPRVSVVIST